MPSCAFPVILAVAGFQWLVIAILIMVGLVTLIMLLMVVSFFNIWIQALLSGVPVSFVSILGMRFRSVEPKVIVYARIRAVKAGLEISSDQLESHYLAGGNVQRVINGLIVAGRNDVDMSFDQACAIDLAGPEKIDPTRVDIDPGAIECMKAVS